MTTLHKIRLLNAALSQFRLLSKKSRYKSRLYTSIDICCKFIISLSGALITYFSDKDENANLLPMKILGIMIASLTAISSVFMLEKRAHSNLQIYGKCEALILEIEEKIESIRSRNHEDNIQEYLHKIFKDLSTLSLASFTDAVFEKIASRRFLE